MQLTSLKSRTGRGDDRVVPQFSFLHFTAIDFLPMIHWVNENEHERKLFNQWIGYNDPSLAQKNVSVTIWLKFLEKCPPVVPGHTFSIGIHGLWNYEIMGKCRSDEWVILVHEKLVDPAGGDLNQVIILLDGIKQKQEVQIAKFDVFADGKGMNME